MLRRYFCFSATLLLFFLVFELASVNAQNKRHRAAKRAHAGHKLKKNAQTETLPCAANLATCQSTGCSVDNHHDLKLNSLKNIRTSDNSTPVDITMAAMKKPHDPKKYKPQSDRQELTNLGEGKTVRLVGYLLAVKPELGGESCNCYLHTPAETDNHLVLVTKTTLDKFKLQTHASAASIKAVFAKRQAESVTVEFTPRVRLDHPNFTHEFLQPMLNTTEQGSMLVRVTGPLMFDSEHFTHNQLPRVNNWEIHPVFHLEYCPKGKVCTGTGMENWLDIDH